MTHFETKYPSFPGETRDRALKTSKEAHKDTSQQPALTPAEIIDYYSQYIAGGKRTPCSG